MAYEELEHFLDTKQARILEMFTIWNFLGFVAGFGLGQVLANLSGVGLLTPLCILLGVVLTLRYRNMLIAVRLWLVSVFAVQRWLGRDVVTGTALRTAVPPAQRVVLLERVVNGQVVYRRRSIR